MDRILHLPLPLAAAMILSGSLVQNEGLWFGIGIGYEAGDRMLESSLLVTSIHQMERKRIYLLADWIVQNKISDGFHPDWNPELKAIWPLSNIDPQDALDRALDAREYKRVLLTPQSTKRATWSLEEQRWSCCTVAETTGGKLIGSKTSAPPPTAAPSADTAAQTRALQSRQTIRR